MFLSVLSQWRVTAFFCCASWCAFWYCCSSCMLKTVVRKQKHHPRHVPFLHHEMCISPLILGLVGEYCHNINECEFSVSDMEQDDSSALCCICLHCCSLHGWRVDGRGGVMMLSSNINKFLLCSKLYGMTSGQPRRLESSVKSRDAHRDMCFWVLGKPGTRELGRLREGEDYRWS